MFVCVRAATACASRSKRARSAPGPSSLITTRRSSWESCATQTSAMPPLLRRSTRRYRPPIVSGTTAVAYGRMGAHGVDLLSFEAAQALVVERVVRLRAEAVPVGEVAGRVLAEPARSAIDLPPFDSSA